jgi:phosphopantothenoylcysteine decarboxylase/phosphopantothenate--cysteine ligase
MENLFENLLLGITGSSAVLGIPGYIALFRQNGIKVRVIMSHSARKFVTPYTMRLYSGNYVFTDSFDTSNDISIPHLQLCRQSNLFLIMPATANIIGKLANGICDDLISTAALASRAPVILVPIMNSDMWYSKANQRNILLLKENGYHIIEPEKKTEKQGALVDIVENDLSPKLSLFMPQFETLIYRINEIISNLVKQILFFCLY